MEETDHSTAATPARRHAGLRPNVARGLLIAGLTAGLALTALDVLQRPGDETLPALAVARVGDQLILRDEWLRAVAAVASERRTPLSVADQQAILERLIDQSLLMQHGLDLGLVARDPRLRGALISEVMQVARDARAAEPAPDELARFYAAHPQRFQGPPQLRVQALRRQADGSLTPLQPPVPDALLPASRLQEWLGPSLSREALALPLDEPRETVDADGRVVQLRVLERVLPTPAPFEAVIEQVRIEWQREADEQAVRELLDTLRQHYDVVRLP